MTRPLHFRPAPPRPDLTVAQILGWADAFLAAVGRWPARNDGTRCLPDTTWSAVDGCLKSGSRGLTPGSSLAKLLLAHRGRRHHKLLPPLTPEQILAWADAQHARTGEWPGQDSGAVAAAPGETWCGVDCARRGAPRTARRLVRRPVTGGPPRGPQLQRRRRSRPSRSSSGPTRTTPAPAGGRGRTAGASPNRPKRTGRR